MANKIKVLTNLTASQDVIVKGNVIISGSKQLSSDSAFNKAVIVTSSGGMYDMNGAIHAVDTSLTTLKNNIKDAYNLVRTVLTGTLDVNGNKKINLTTTITSGSLYFSTSSLTSVEASVLIDENEDSVYKNDLVSLQLYNSASYLWVEIDAPMAINDAYSLIVKNQLDFPINGSAGGGGNSGGGGGDGNGGGGGNLYIIFAPITTPTGSVNDSVTDAHESYYVYPNNSGSVTITINNFSASTNDGGIAFYSVPNNYTGSITYDGNTDIINSNGLQRIITLAGNIGNTQYTAPQTNTLDPISFPGGGNGQVGYSVIMPNLTSSVINDGSTITVTIPVGTGSSVYVDTYSNSTPTTYNFNWSGGEYRNTNNTQSVYVSTFVTGGYWVAGALATVSSSVNITGSGDAIKIPLRFNNGFLSTALVKPPPTNLGGKTIDQFYIKWYGPGDVVVSLAQNWTDLKAPFNGGQGIYREPGETGVYFMTVTNGGAVRGSFDNDTLIPRGDGTYYRHNNFRLIQTRFASEWVRQGYSPNYDFSINPIQYNSGRPPEGYAIDGTMDPTAGIIIINGDNAYVELWFTYI